MRNLLILLFFVTLQAEASIVAIIDSGTDMEHEMIMPKAFVNMQEIPDNNRDEDRNGYQDDVYGWNFAESNNEVIDYSYLGLLDDDIRLFFDLQVKMFKGTIQSDELAWMEQARNNQDFLKRLGVYGNFMHGTHVAGISIRANERAKVLAVKLIPTEVKLPGDSKTEAFSIAMGKAAQVVSEDENGEGLGDFLLKQAFSLLASQQMNVMEEIGRYIDSHKVDVANGSFGTGFPQAAQIVQVLFKKFLRKDATKEQIIKYATYLINELIKEGQRFVGAAPNALFVFAAGNDALNNDLYPTSPTNIKADNVISVAASMDLYALAPFSNYGEKNVDVAAPGVGIESAVPGNKYLKVSGTSQAAPYVSHVASLIKDANPTLTPFAIKRIIMETVDFREFLIGVVKTGGLVNMMRAVEAARISTVSSLDEAIIQANQMIPDQEGDMRFGYFNKGMRNPVMMIEGTVLPLPSPLKVRDTF